jgi:hypothetical protein
MQYLALRCIVGAAGSSPRRPPPHPTHPPSAVPAGDLGTQYFADRGIFCAGRVADEDLQRVAKATGARVQTTVNNLDVKVLGTCATFEEKQVGGWLVCVELRAWQAWLQCCGAACYIM